MYMPITSKINIFVGKIHEKNSYINLCAFIKHYILSLFTLKTQFRPQCRQKEIINLNKIIMLIHDNIKASSKTNIFCENICRIKLHEKYIERKNKFTIFHLSLAKSYMKEVCLFLLCPHVQKSKHMQSVVSFHLRKKIQKIINQKYATVVFTTFILFRLCLPGLLLMYVE